MSSPSLSDTDKVTITEWASRCRVVLDILDREDTLARYGMTHQALTELRGAEASDALGIARNMASVEAPELVGRYEELAAIYGSFQRFYLPDGDLPAALTPAEVVFREAIEKG